MATMDKTDVVFDPIHRVRMGPDRSAAGWARRSTDTNSTGLFMGHGKEAPAVTATGNVPTAHREGCEFPREEPTT